VKSVRVFINVPSGDGNPDLNAERSMSRVPMIGEYVCLDEDQPWRKVIAVVHHAFPDLPSVRKYDAEIWTEGKQTTLSDFDPPLHER
jgi:hypothetical protein